MKTYDGPYPTTGSSARKPHFRLPKRYDSETIFLQEMRDLFADNTEADRLNREAAIEDLRFVIGDQWDDLVRQRRDAARKPTLTINRLPAFVAQVIGQRRQNDTQVKIEPDNGGTQPIAHVREGLLRSIQKISRAKLAYDNALAGSVMCGIGNFQACIEDSTNDIWAREIRVRQILDHLAVVWDRHITDPTGADAEVCFVIETMPKRLFYQKWPWATPADVTTDLTLRADLRMTGWVGIEDVRVVDYWRMRQKKRLYALTQAGATVDITDIDADTPDGAGMISQIATMPTGEPIIREVIVRYAQLYVCSGLDILEGPFEYAIDRIPVFRVPGYEVKTGDWSHRWGIVRFAKDPQRLHNYWRSAVAEKLMQTPRASWMAADSAVAGREQEWRVSHLSDDPLLIWNSESGQKPERVPPAIMEDALINQAMITSQDIKDVTNIHEANLGMPSNEVSGAAINARKEVSDTGTAVYHDNLNMAIEECGRVCNALIPIIYDSARIVKVLGEDGKEWSQAINDADNPMAVDITSGKYSVTATTGPSYATKRVESATAMSELATAMPQVLSVAADLIVEAQDWPDKDKIARRLRQNMPGINFEPDELTPLMQQNAAAQQQGQAQQTQMLLQKMGIEMRAKDSQTTLNLARAHNFMTQSAMQAPKMATQAANTQSQIADRRVRAQLEAVRVYSGD